MSQTYHVGQHAEVTRTFSAADVAAFAAISGDDNPVHLDADYAAATRFGQRIVHGILVTSLFSRIFGAVLPGHGAIYLAQSVMFKAPVHLDETVTARVELVTLREDKPIGTFATTVTKADGTVAVSGEATLLLP